MSPVATEEEVRKAYRRLCLECHPDRNPGDPHAEDRFKEVSIAYGILSSQEKRQVFDMGSGDVGENINATIRTFVSSFGDFLDRFSVESDEPSQPKAAPARKKAKAKAKAKPRYAKKVRCTKCNDRGFQILRQGSSEFKTPCRSCSTSA